LFPPGRLRVDQTRGRIRGNRLSYCNRWLGRECRSRLSPAKFPANTEFNGEISNLGWWVVDKGTKNAA
jgi:hypothetical protein